VDPRSVPRWEIDGHQDLQPSPSELPRHGRARRGRQRLRGRRRQGQMPGQPVQPSRKQGDAVSCSISTRDDKRAVKNLGHPQEYLPPQHQASRRGVPSNCDRQSSRSSASTTASLSFGSTTRIRRVKHYITYLTSIQQVHSIIYYLYLY
jgi:hypothetical protein